MAPLRLLISVGSALAPYVATTPSGRAVATLHRATWPKQPWLLEIDRRQYRIEHAVTTNKVLLNDHGFRLVDEAGTLLASCIAKPAVRSTDVVIGETTYRLVRQKRLLSVHYAVEDGNGRQLGSIGDASAFALWRRTFRIDMPEQIGLPAAMFLFYLVATFSFR